MFAEYKFNDAQFDFADPSRTGYTYGNGESLGEFRIPTSGGSTMPIHVLNVRE